MASTVVEQSISIASVSADLPILKEATTSRVVVNNDVLRVVDFVFDAGQLLTEHASPKAVVVTLLEGEMEFDVAGETTLLSDGGMIYLAPGERHALRAVTPCRMRLVMVNV